MFIFAIQIIEIMKKGIHPENYRLVVMQDISTGHTVLTKSTANTKDTIMLIMNIKLTEESLLKYRFEVY